MAVLEGVIAQISLAHSTGIRTGALPLTISRPVVAVTPVVPTKMLTLSVLRLDTRIPLTRKSPAVVYSWTAVVDDTVVWPVSRFEEAPIYT